jgi:hypothetical protein
MKLRWVLSLALLGCSAQTQAPSLPIVWHPWSNEVFEQAVREHKFVLLDLEAVYSIRLFPVSPRLSARHPPALRRSSILEFSILAYAKPNESPNSPLRKLKAFRNARR